MSTERRSRLLALGQSPLALQTQPSHLRLTHVATSDSADPNAALKTPTTLPNQLSEGGTIAGTIGGGLDRRCQWFLPDAQGHVAAHQRGPRNLSYISLFDSAGTEANPRGNHHVTRWRHHVSRGSMAFSSPSRSAAVNAIRPAAAQ